MKADFQLDAACGTGASFALAYEYAMFVIDQGGLSSVSLTHSPSKPKRAHRSGLLYPPNGSWPEEMTANMAAAYVGEVSVAAFLSKVGTIWPWPVTGPRSRKKWSREALLAAIRSRHGLAACGDEPDDAANLI